VLYVVLAGADFGAGLWLVLSGPGERGARIREHAHHSMAPVWEANHVWLIFVLTVTWTAYPAFFGSVASTLGAALLLAGLGIILRGASYALRAGADSHRGRQAIDTAFAIASLVTPFALGAAAGAIAAERIPVGNATGSEFASWLNPTSAAIGVLAVVFAAYLAAVYLAADAARIGDTELEAAFRRRALGAGVLAGAVALATLVVVHGDARSLYDELLRGGALAAMIASGLSGVATLGLVRAAPLATRAGERGARGRGGHRRLGPGPLPNPAAGAERRSGGRVRRNPGDPDRRGGGRRRAALSVPRAALRAAAQRTL